MIFGNPYYFFLLLLTPVFIGLFMWTHQRRNAALARFGPRWQIRSLGDWSSLPLLIALAALLSFFGEPLANTFRSSQ